VWKLVSCEAIRRNGSSVPVYGKRPVGRLYYDAAGNMSVHIMKGERSRFGTGTRNGAALAEMSAAYEGYEAYFSTYVVDPERQVISHKVVGSLFPNWTGTVQSRYYEFEGDDRLVLSTEPIGTVPGDKPVVNLVWERLA
jgi:hypothetical protein